MKNKISNVDFTYESFPKTRREQFFQVMKDNFRLFIKIGLVLLLFLLPFLCCYFFKESSIRAISADPSLTEENKRAMALTVEMIFNGGYVLCSCAFFVGLSGVLKVIRRLLWNEPLFFKEDFFLGIKENVFQSILIGVVIGLIYFVCFLSYRFLPSDIKFISYIIIGISFAIIVPILIQTLYISSIYKNKIHVSFMTSTRLFIRRGIFFILPLLLIYAMYFISIIPIGTIFLCLIYIAVFVLLLPLILLLSYILEIKFLDDYINTYYYPEYAYLGLYISEERKQEIKENVEKAKEKNTL